MLKFFTHAKLKIPISQQRKVIETSCKNWHVQKNQLYKLRYMERDTYWGRGTYYGEYSKYTVYHSNLHSGYPKPETITTYTIPNNYFCYIIKES